MRFSIAITAVCLSCATTPNSGHPNGIGVGDDIGQVAAIMSESGYRETGMDMMASSADEDLRMWVVGEGVLIFRYSIADNRVLGISYFLCDERPKSIRSTFDLEVERFNPVTGEMAVVFPRETPQRHALTHEPQSAEPLE